MRHHRARQPLRLRAVLEALRRARRRGDPALGQPALVGSRARSATSPTTTSATSPSRTTRSARASSWAASRGAIRTLNFGFMEGGVSWACQMCLDLIEHWEKRHRAGLQYPSATDVGELQRLIDRYGDERLKAKAEAIMGNLDAFRPECSLEELSRPEHVVDDFEAAGVKSKADLRDSVHRELLLRLRGRRPRDDVGLRPAYGHPAAAGLQLRLHPFRRARFRAR